MTKYYYFLKRSVDDVMTKYPFCSMEFLGEIGDYVDIDGVGYIITDYAIEAGGAY